MLNLTAQKDNDLLTMELAGRLDTVTAPDLQNAYQEESSGVSTVVLDCKDLTYISSAGLRVLLTIRKSLTGELRMKNVAPTVMEVLEITGFADILVIE